MASKEQGGSGGGGEEQQETTAKTPTNWRESIEDRYLKIRQHAEEFPYVWASYIVVYGGIALWTGYRWRKLRKTEDRVRGLQARLKALVEAEDAAAASSSSTAPIAKSPDKTPEK